MPRHTSTVSGYVYSLPPRLYCYYYYTDITIPPPPLIYYYWFTIPTPVILLRLYYPRFTVTYTIPQPRLYGYYYIVIPSHPRLLMMILILILFPPTRLYWYCYTDIVTPPLIDYSLPSFTVIVTYTIPYPGYTDIMILMLMLMLYTYRISSRAILLHSMWS